MQKRKNIEPQTRHIKGGNARPVWNAVTGDLYWRGRLVLHLAVQAHCERAILNEFQQWKWRFVVKSPLPRENVGDQTASRRKAIYNLMRRQGSGARIKFFSAFNGFIAWCPADWLDQT